MLSASFGRQYMGAMLSRPGRGDQVFGRSGRRRWNHVKLIPAFLVFLGFLVLPGRSQVSSGSLLGDVRDEKSAFVAGVAIQARNNATGFIRSAVSNAIGAYRMDDLLPGAYTV